MDRYIAAIALSAALGLGCVAAQAAPVKKPVTTEFSKIKSIDTYSGDTTVFLEKNPPGCEQGFWMRPNHAGFKENLKVIESAAHQNTRVKIVGDGGDLWKQLEDRNCRLERVSVEAVPNPGTKADTDGEQPIDERKIKEEEAQKANALKPPSATDPTGATPKLAAP
jgi:hypothetical protein